MTITATDLAKFKELLSYNPATGVFMWKTSARGRSRSLIAGCRNVEGYVKIHIGTQRSGRTVLAHRLAWAWIHGSDASGGIDHINRIRDDNRAANLRLITARRNILNSDRYDKISASNIGATYHRRANKWQAQISIEGRRTYLGLFSSRAAAARAYRSALAKMDPSLSVELGGAR